MKLVLCLRMRVLHRDLRTEFNVRSDPLSELLIVRSVCRVQGRHIELYKSLSLLLGDPEVCRWTLMRWANPSSRVKRSGPPKGLSGEGGQVVDMFWLAVAEEWLE